MTHVVTFVLFLWATNHTNTKVGKNKITFIPPMSFWTPVNGAFVVAAVVIFLAGHAEFFFFCQKSSLFAFNSFDKKRWPAI